MSAVGQQGHQSVLPEIVQVQKADTPERLESVLARIGAYPALTDAVIELMAEGREAGLTAARVVADRVVDQLEAGCSRRRPRRRRSSRTRPSPGKPTGPACSRPWNATCGLPTRATWRRSGGATCRPRATSPGLCAVPDGEARYAAKVRAYTSLDVTPDELHEVGLGELQEIEAERREIAGAAGFGDDTAAYRAALNADPAQIPPTPEALVARCQEDVDRAFAAAPRLFSRIPQAGCEVRRVEELLEKDAPGAYYYPPTIDGSRGRASTS